MASNHSTCRLALLASLAVPSTFAASFTTCAISNSATGAIITQSAGPTGCSLTSPSSAPGGPHRSSAGVTHTTWYGMTAGAISYPNNDGAAVPVRIESQAVTSQQGIAIFSNLSQGNFLELEFDLIVESHEMSFEFSLGGTQFKNKYGRQSVLIPITPESPVFIDASLRVFCYVSGYQYCSAATTYSLMALDVVNAAGVSQSGYTYGFLSGVTIQPSETAFKSGTHNPEPVTWALTLLGLAVVVGLQRRKSLGSRM